jgi:hypothetical protein
MLTLNEIGPEGATLNRRTIKGMGLALGGTRSRRPLISADYPQNLGSPFHVCRRAVARCRPPVSGAIGPMPSLFATNVDALVRRFGAAPALPQAPGTRARLDTAATAHPAIGTDATWLHNLLPTPVPNVVCAIGLGQDLALDVLVDLLDLHRTSEGSSKPAHLVLLEPEPADARKLLERRAWADLIDAGRLAILVGPDYAGLSTVAQVIPGVGTAPVLVHPSLAAQPEVVGRVREVLARLAFQHDANAAARRALSGRYLLHTLANAPTIAREGDAGRLRGAFAGTPALIAAAGPSLNRNINELAPVRDNALVIACDTAALPMLSAGLAPHLVVAVDASEANARHLAAFPSGRTWLAAEASVHPSAVRPFAGRTFFFKVSDHEPWPWLGSFGLDRARLDAWGSVMTTAFALALEMGCDPIVFIGADLAFTGGLPYCRGTSFEATWASWVGGGDTYEQVWQQLLKRWPATEAPALDGSPTRTAPHLLAFRDWIAERAAVRVDRTIVNGTGAGLLMGPAIQQAVASSPLWSRPGIDRDLINETLRQAHGGGANLSTLSHLFAAATSIVAGPPADRDPLIERWRAFADGTVTSEAIRAVLASPEQRSWALGAAAYRQLMEAS